MKRPAFPLYPPIDTPLARQAFREELTSWIKGLPEKKWADLCMYSTSIEDEEKTKELYPSIRFFYNDHIVKWVDKKKETTERLFVAGAILDMLLIRTASYMAKMMSKHQRGELTPEESERFSIYHCVDDDQLWSTYFEYLPALRELAAIRNHMGINYFFRRNTWKATDPRHKSVEIVDDIRTVFVGWNNLFAHDRYQDLESEVVWSMSSGAFEKPTDWKTHEWMQASKKYLGLAAIIAQRCPELIPTYELLTESPLLYEAIKIGRIHKQSDAFIQAIQQLRANPPPKIESIDPLDHTSLNDKI